MYHLFTLMPLCLYAYEYSLKLKAARSWDVLIPLMISCCSASGHYSCKLDSRYRGDPAELPASPKIWMRGSTCYFSTYISLSLFNIQEHIVAKLLSNLPDMICW